MSIILGIDTSCDDTSIAIVDGGTTILSNVVASQVDVHHRYGGVVPELACRKHIEAIGPVYQTALDEAKMTLADLDVIAVTRGPGLIGALLVGLSFAKSLAYATGKPLIPINHLEGHICSAFLEAPDLAWPFVCLVVSGGHTDLYACEGPGVYRLLGETRDDAAGEAFDKVAKILGLPYPGGVSVSRKADEGNPHAFHIPKARMEGKYDFSFSGPKTAVLRLAQEQVGKDYSLPSYELPGLLNEVQKADIAASFQRVACETIVDKAVQAFQEFAPNSVVMGGGVAASNELRRQLEERLPCPIEYPDPKLCGDNGGMIAALGCFQAMSGQPIADAYGLETHPNLSM